MGKILVEQSGGGLCTLKLPPELILYLKDRKFPDGKAFRIFSAYKNDSIFIIISNFYWNKEGGVSKFFRNTSKTIFKKGWLSYSHQMRLGNLNKKFTKANGRGALCSKYQLDYNIFEDGDYSAIISYVNIGDVFQLPSRDTEGFVSLIYPIVNHIYGASYLRTQLSSNSDEFYHFLGSDTDSLEITYVTKDKYNDVYLNNNYDTDTEYTNTLLKNSRKISLTKFINRVLPDIDIKTIQQYIEYNKLVGTYDPSRFFIVSGDDICKYYKEDSYLKVTGDLGSSCMRHSEKNHYMKFYANNKNIRLLILKLNGNDDKIMARALLWTTTSGDVVMDRIYTSDSRLISVFHKYADEHNIVNVYNIRKVGDSVGRRNLNAMSPANWKQDYDKNYIVDIEVFPELFVETTIFDKFHCAFSSRRTSMTDSFNFPYMDNFNLVNSVTNQVSLLPIEDTFKCELTDTYINMSNYIEHNGNLYNRKYVHIKNNKPVLIEDVVTLDPEPELEQDMEDSLSSFDWEDVEVGLDEPELVINVNQTSRRQRTPQSILDYFNIVPEQQNQDTTNV